MLTVFFLIQDSLQEETSSKLAISSKLKDSDNEISRLNDQLEEEEDARQALQKQMQSVQTQVRTILSS
jgi:myosin protein heavy chain